jgi:hypothetical protein
LSNELTLLSGSGEDNSLLQWAFDENSEFKFTKIRQRKGMKDNLNKLKFYGYNGKILFIYLSSIFKETIFWQVLTANPLISTTYHY